MPKLELKPWRLNEPQVVWMNKSHNFRVVVEFINVGDGEVIKKGDEFRMVNFEYCLPTLDALGNERWKEARTDIELADEFVNLLGIPETIGGEG